MLQRNKSHTCPPILITFLRTYFLYLYNSAEDWDLSTPLKTVQLLVERRNDSLCFDFTHNNALFCAASVQTGDNEKIPSNWLEQVVDSSRYFVVKIQGAGGKEATIGFGFRDRDFALNLREAIQHYETSVSRQTKELADYKVPTLKEGETIHVTVKGGSAAKPKSATKQRAAGGGVPLLKKPPPAAADVEAPPTTPVNPKVLDKIAISLGDIDLEADKQADADDASGSAAAVFTGDDAEWATQFDTPK
jgi:hypothetical protein